MWLGDEKEALRSDRSSFTFSLSSFAHGLPLVLTDCVTEVNSQANTAIAPDLNPVLHLAPARGERTRSLLSDSSNVKYVAHRSNTTNYYSTCLLFFAKVDRRGR
jgi:hypothetical protein